MRHHFRKELLAEHHDILAARPWRTLTRVAVVPDLSFSQKVEPRLVDDPRRVPNAIGSEENRRAEDPLERPDQPPILLSAVRESEHFEHRRRRLEPDRLTRLPNCKRGQKYGYQPILAERQPKIRVPRDLQDELTVPPLEKKLILRRPPDRQSAKHKRPRGEPERLASLLAV